MTLQSQTLDELPLPVDDELRRTKRAAWRMFFACITLSIVTVVLSVTAWQQLDTEAALNQDNARLWRLLSAEQDRRRALEAQLDAQTNQPQPQLKAEP